MAKSMGREVEFDYYSKRALNYQNVFDKETLFMRARKSDSTFRKPFDPLYAQYGGDYTEGNAWQYSWYVPHDVQGLINLMGGKEVFLKRLDSLFVIEGDEDQFKHVEDIAGLIGQYAHGNEPSHHIAYLYNYAGEPWKTQFRIHQIMKNLFNNTPYGIPGNEDCGQMSAWYIFSSLGFYPVCPGSNEYVIGSPCIPKATIKLASGNNFTMEAQNLTETNIYIQSATLNGEPLTRSYITHEEILNGSILIFKMGDQPNKALWSNPEAAPYSMSRK
jgi:predicted alpha-1,2-mannosidase